MKCPPAKADPKSPDNYQDWYGSRIPSGTSDLNLKLLKDEMSIKELYPPA
jgi:hypothetical protein